MTDIRQSKIFSTFMKDLGWQTELINKNYIYFRKFPILGYFAKMPRPNAPFDFPKISVFIKNHLVFQFKISPYILTAEKEFNNYHSQFLDNFQIDYSPFNPTTNFLINLTKSEEEIFKNFTEAKRRGVRRALKNGIKVKETDDIESFIKIRGKQYAPLGFLVRIEMEKLWKNLYPKNALLLLAYTSSNTPVAGILLLIYDNIAYYWYASALKEGKKLFAPTLLVWEALKLVKKRGCKIFDFEGIYDERFPQASESWKGFTKFKEGFGGEKVVYMENFKLR